MPDSLAPLVSAIGLTLLHFLWQGALLGLLSVMSLAVLRSARPELRYAVAGVALLACLVLLLVTLTLELGATSALSTPALAEGSRMSGLAASSAVAGRGFFVAPNRLVALAPWVTAFWAAGSSFFCTRLMLGLVWVFALRRTPQGPASQAWQGRFADLTRRFGLVRRVELLVVEGLDSPISAGWWRPMVVLPASMLTRMPPELIEALLAHELAHIRRHDYLVNLLQNVAEALLFFHPAVWWLSHRLRVERELVADQLAAEVTGQPRRLAKALAELSELREFRTGFNLAQAAGRGDLATRIERLVRPGRPAPSGLWLALPLLLATVVGLAAVGDAPSGGRRSKENNPARVSFALVEAGKEEVRAWGPDDDIHLAAETHRASDRDVMLVRRAGRDYLVTDPLLLEPVRRAWNEAEGLNRRLASLYSELEAANGERQVDVEIVAMERRVGAAYQNLPSVLRHLLDQAWARGLAVPVEPLSG